MGFVEKHRQGLAVAFCAIGLLALYVVPSFPVLPFLFDQTLQRVLLFGLAALFVAALGGSRALAPSAGGLSRALREGFYPVGVALALCGIEAIALVQLVGEVGGTGVSATFPMDLLGLVLFCGSVGLYEEALFRVLLLGGLLSRHGGSRSGLVASLLVSSALFGVAHVGASAALDPLTLAQMLLKTAQTGCVGLLLGVVYLRTRSFLGVATLHALADFFLMAPLALTGGIEGSLGGYVSQGDGLPAVVTGMVLVAVYLVAVAIYVPAAMRAWRLAEGLRVPEPGPLSGGWEPCRDEGLGPAGGGRPVRPSGL